MASASTITLPMPKPTARSSRSGSSAFASILRSDPLVWTVVVVLLLLGVFAVHRTHLNGKDSAGQALSSSYVALDVEEAAAEGVEVELAAGRSTAAEQKLQGRARAAVLGAFVADAASMGLHWLYNQTRIKELLEERGATAQPEFLDPPFNAFYQYTSGSSSPYGDELLPVLQYLAATQQLQPQPWTSFLYRYYKQYRRGQYMNKSAKAMVANGDAGATWPLTGDPNDYQVNALVKVPPIVARYAGLPGLAEAVDAAARAQQNNDGAVESAQAAARILERVVLGSSVAEAVQWAAGAEGFGSRVQAEIQQALRQAREGGQELGGVLAANGLSCRLPDAWINTLVAVSLSPDYALSVRANIVAGGDSCSRAVLIGALLAAEGGEAVIPQDWRSKTNRYTEVQQLTQQLLNRRKGATASA